VQATPTLVYEQPTVWAGDGTTVGTSWTSHADATETGFRTSDNFSLSSASIIDYAIWWGIYIDDTGKDASPNTASWSMRVSLDSGTGLPGAALTQETIPASDVNTQIVGSGFLNGNPVTVYQFSTHISHFTALAATPYWFSPRSTGSTFLPAFSWIEGTGGDDRSVQSAFTNGVVTAGFIRDGDRAFALLLVPEPMTLALTCAALVALAATRRRHPGRSA